MKALAGILLCLFFVSWAIARGINAIVFNIDCDGHLKRAADSNTVELATQEMKTVISYMEREGMTAGYTSVIYRTPDEDVGFWYQNLKSSLEELEKVSPQATQLEKSNLLIKLRETLLDEGQSVGVTEPQGISVFPNNGFYLFWSIAGFLLMGAILEIMYFVFPNEVDRMIEKGGI